MVTGSHSPQTHSMKGDIMIHFEPEEFDCKCDYNCGLGVYQMNLLLMEKIDAARTIADIPFPINSAVRCAKHNKEVGGVDTSSHLKGLAVDIRCTGSTARYKMIKALLLVGIPRIGVGENFLHCDMDYDKGHPAIFTYY